MPTTGDPLGGDVDRLPSPDIASYLQRWSDAGTTVLVLQDSPYPGRTLAIGARLPGLHRTNQPACGGTPETWGRMDPLFAAATGRELPGSVDNRRAPLLLHGDDVPRGHRGLVVTYFDASHMTATYARSIAPFVEAEILAALASKRSR